MVKRQLKRMSQGVTIVYLLCLHSVPRRPEWGARFWQRRFRVLMQVDAPGQANLIMNRVQRPKYRGGSLDLCAEDMLDVSAERPHRPIIWRVHLLRGFTNRY